MPLMVCTARKIAPPAAVAPAPPAPRWSSSSAWLTAVMCSRLSVRKSSAYWRLSIIIVPASARRAPARNSAERATLKAHCLTKNALHRFQHAARLERLDDEVLGAGLDGL